MKQFINKNLTTIILIGVIVYAIILLKNYREEAIRWQDNYEQTDSSRYHKLFNFTKQEFKQLHKKDTTLRELMDSLKINYRHIERTINHNYKHVYDTTITHLYPKASGTKSFLKRFDNCLTISGEIDYEKDMIIFDNTVMTYDATSVYYWKRKRKFLKFIPWGRKQHFVETKNNCSGKTTVEEFNIVKK